MAQFVHRCREAVLTGGDGRRVRPGVPVPALDQGDLARVDREAAQHAVHPPTGLIVLLSMVMLAKEGSLTSATVTP